MNLWVTNYDKTLLVFTKENVALRGRNNKLMLDNAEIISANIKNVSVIIK